VITPPRWQPTNGSGTTERSGGAGASVGWLARDQSHNVAVAFPVFRRADTPLDDVAAGKLTAITMAISRAAHWGSGGGSYQPCAVNERWGLSTGPSRTIAESVFWCVLPNIRQLLSGLYGKLGFPAMGAVGCRLCNCGWSCGSCSAACWIYLKRSSLYKSLAGRGCSTRFGLAALERANAHLLGPRPGHGIALFAETSMFLSDRPVDRSGLRGVSPASGAPEFHPSLTFMVPFSLRWLSPLRVGHNLGLDGNARDWAVRRPVDGHGCAFAV